MEALGLGQVVRERRQIKSEEVAGYEKVRGGAGMRNMGKVPLMGQEEDAGIGPKQQQDYQPHPISMTATL